MDRVSTIDMSAAGSTATHRRKVIPDQLNLENDAHVLNPLFSPTEKSSNYKRKKYGISELSALRNSTINRVTRPMII